MAVTSSIISTVVVFILPERLLRMVLTSLRAPPTRKGREQALDIGLKPDVGESVKAGDRLFSAGHNQHKAHFPAPRKDSATRENRPHGQNRVGVVEGEGPDAELPGSVSAPGVEVVKVE